MKYYWFAFTIVFTSCFFFYASESCAISKVNRAPASLSFFKEKLGLKSRVTKDMIIAFPTEEEEDDVIVVSPGGITTEFTPVLNNNLTKSVGTMHEGTIGYKKFLNFWVRPANKIVHQTTSNTGYFFSDLDYFDPNGYISNMLDNTGIAWSVPTKNEKEVWDRIKIVWNWLKIKTSSGAPPIVGKNGWASVMEFADYYANNRGTLAWGTCFSRAHLFATILYRVGIERWRAMITTAHWNNDGNTLASHVYVSVYLDNKWYYLDPSWIGLAFPEYEQRKSIGGNPTCDYKHPFSVVPPPGSIFTSNEVPLIE